MLLLLIVLLLCFGNFIPLDARYRSILGAVLLFVLIVLILQASGILDMGSNRMLRC